MKVFLCALLLTFSADERVSLIRKLAEGAPFSPHPVSIIFLIISIVFSLAAAAIIITGKKAGK